MKSILKSLIILFIYILPVNAACDFMVDIGEKGVKINLICAKSNYQLLKKQIYKYQPKYAFLYDHKKITNFDKKQEYINKWVNCNSSNYPNEIIDHKSARQRCLETYKKYLD